MKNETARALFFLICILACWLLLSVAALVAILSLTGCAGGDYYGTRDQIRDANATAAIGFTGVGRNAPGILAQLAKQGSWLTAIGAGAFLSGCIVFARAGVAAGVALGLIGGGAGLILLAYLLPLYGGWAFAFIAIAAAAYLAPSVFARFKGITTAHNEN